MNSEDAYTIQYPTDLGSVNADYGPFTRRTILTWHNFQGYYLQIYFIDPHGVDLTHWLAKNATLGPHVTRISVNGLDGIIEAPGLVFLQSQDPMPIIYELDFECSSGAQPTCEPPSFWRDMINSFRTLTPDVL